MKKRPPLFYLVSISLLAIAISIPTQILLLYGHPVEEIYFAFSKMTVMNWISCATLGGLSLAALNGSRSLYILIPLSIAVIGWNNFLVGSWGYDYNLTTTWWSTTLFAAGCGFLFLPQYFQVLQYPEQRWWLVAKRISIHLPVEVSPFRGHEFTGKTLDVSQTGAFIEGDDALLKLGEMIDLNLKLNTLQNLQVRAEVVRKSKEDSRFAVHFHDLGQDQKKLLSKYVH